MTVRTVLAALCFSFSAMAQSSALPQNFSAERMRLALSRESILDVESGSMRNEGFHWDASLYGGYAKNPLVLYRLSDKTRASALVQDRVGVSGVFAIGYGRFQLGVEVPFVLMNERSTQNEPFIGTPPTISGFGVGDIRVVPKVSLLNHSDHFVDGAILASVFIPSSGGTRYLGSDSVSITPEIALSKPFGNLKVALNISLTVRTAPVLTLLNQSIDNEMLGRLGIAYRFNLEDPKALPLEIGATVMTGFALAAPFASSNQVPAELKGYVAYDFVDGIQAFAGAGMGLAPGYAIPDFRVFAGLRVGSVVPGAAPVVANSDIDNDGIPDAQDKCTGSAEDKDGFEDGDGCADPDNDGDAVLDAKDQCRNLKGSSENLGCPDVDTDGDGVVERLDLCPHEAEDKDNFEDTDGCIDSDNDKDGVLDADDKCVDVKGPKENAGCPDGDKDSDKVVDRLDNCPNEAGSEANHGCKAKQLATLEAGRIVILEQVYFASGKSIIEKRSFPLLDNVMRIMKDHTEISKLNIEGHTDSQGDDAANLKLSGARVAAVKEYLVKQGVEAARLEAKGFGETKPIADNSNALGRSKNRRVEFNIP
jgi:outer membrane protein OmpA-like peptidoglycan-associated protein/opacity protein-like surface antigen